MAFGWKVFTHDLCPPVQGGDPVWDGATPHTLPSVTVDRSDDDCGSGWNFCTKPDAALRIAGLWPTGRPSRLFLIETPGRAAVVERGEKTRASRLTLVREATDEEVKTAIVEFSKAFEPHAGVMAAEQLAWREALARPHREPKAVETGLAEALAARGLAWKLRRFDETKDAWDARDAWAAWDARDAWDAWSARAAWDAWAAWATSDARDARDAWATSDARDAWAAWDARDARDAWAAWDARDAWDAWDARDARAALTVGFASRQRWVEHDADLLTRGIRGAYRNGLELAIPTGPDELGWSMAE